MTKDEIIELLKEQLRLANESVSSLTILPDLLEKLEEIKSSNSYRINAVTAF